MTVVYSRKRLRAQRPSTEAPSGPTSAAPPSTQPQLPSRLHSAKRRKVVQMHLDAGQADISASSCPTCGMVYAAGAVGDDVVHRAHHAAFLRRRKISFKGVKGMRVLDETENGKYLAVRAGDPQTQVRAVRGVDGFVTGLLGAYSDAFATFGEGWRGTEMGWMAIVYVVGGETKGYLYAERVERAVEAFVEPDGITVVNGKEMKRALCGVRKVWVKEDARRGGVATALVDLARTNLIYGHVVEACDVAFTATTTSGGKLASSLAKRSGRDRILVYTR